jgi:hypothetical protein
MSGLGGGFEHRTPDQIVCPLIWYLLRVVHRASDGQSLRNQRPGVLDGGTAISHMSRTGQSLGHTQPCVDRDQYVGANGPERTHETFGRIQKRSLRGLVITKLDPVQSSGRGPQNTFRYRRFRESIGNEKQSGKRSSKRHLPTLPSIGEDASA